MTTSLIDWSKPYGTVYGEEVDYAYEQDGRKYDHQGKEISDKVTEKKEK